MKNDHPPETNHQRQTHLNFGRQFFFESFLQTNSCFYLNTKPFSFAPFVNLRLVSAILGAKHGEKKAGAPRAINSSSARTHKSGNDAYYLQIIGLFLTDFGSKAHPQPQKQKKEKNKQVTMDQGGGGGVGAMRARFEGKEQDTNVSNLRNKFEKNKSQGTFASEKRKGEYFRNLIWTLSFLTSPHDFILQTPLSSLIFSFCFHLFISFLIVSCFAFLFFCRQ